MGRLAVATASAGTDLRLSSNAARSPVSIGVDAGAGQVWPAPSACSASVEHAADGLVDSPVQVRVVERQDLG